MVILCCLMFVLVFFEMSLNLILVVPFLCFLSIGSLYAA